MAALTRCWTTDLPESHQPKALHELNRRLPLENYSLLAALMHFLDRVIQHSERNLVRSIAQRYSAALRALIALRWIRCTAPAT